MILARVHARVTTEDTTGDTCRPMRSLSELHHSGACVEQLPAATILIPVFFRSDVRALPFYMPARCLSRLVRQAVSDACVQCLWCPTEGTIECRWMPYSRGRCRGCFSVLACSFHSGRGPATMKPYWISQRCRHSHRLCAMENASLEGCGWTLQ